MQTERLGVWRGKVAYIRAHTRTRKLHTVVVRLGFGYVVQNAHISLYSANAVFGLTGVKRKITQ